MAMGDISNNELLLTGVPTDALGDEQVDEDLPSEGTGNKEPEISKYIQLSEFFKRRRSCVSSRRQKVVCNELKVVFDCFSSGQAACHENQARFCVPEMRTTQCGEIITVGCKCGKKFFYNKSIHLTLPITLIAIIAKLEGETIRTLRCMVYAEYFLVSMLAQDLASDHF